MPKRTDSNQKEIVQTFRDLCADVLVLSEVGHGCPDILVGMGGKNYLVEIKDGKKPPSARKLTEDEQKFHTSWRGHVCVLTSVDEVIRFMSNRG